MLVVFTLAWAAAGWAQRGIVRAFARAHHVDATLIRFLAKGARYFLLVASLVSCLSAFGITATRFAAVIGAAGIAIGLAFQGTLSNLAAGLTLLLFRPFRALENIAYYPTRRAEVWLPFPLRANVEALLPQLVERARALPNAHAEPAPDARNSGLSRPPGERRARRVV